jgi:hypothetical protein
MLNDGTIRVDFIKLIVGKILNWRSFALHLPPLLGAVQFSHTRLCRWMVYSRATTSEMAERDFLPVCFVCLGVVEGLSLAIAAVLGRWFEGGGIGCRGGSIEAPNFSISQDHFWKWSCAHVTQTLN